MEKFCIDKVENRQCDPNYKIQEFIDEYSSKNNSQIMTNDIVDICHADIDNFMAWFVKCGKESRDKMRDYLDSIDNCQGNIRNIKMDIGQTLGQEYFDDNDDNVVGDININNNSLMVEMNKVYDNEWNVVGEVISKEEYFKIRMEKIITDKKFQNKRRQEFVVPDLN